MAQPNVRARHKLGAEKHMTTHQLAEAILLWGAALLSPASTKVWVPHSVAMRSESGSSRP